MARPANTGSRSVRVAKPGVAAQDTVGVFGGPVIYGPAEKRQAGGKRPLGTAQVGRREKRPTYGGGGSYSSSVRPSAQPSGMHSLQAYNAYGQPYTGAPTQHSAMVGTRPTYMDPMTGQQRHRFVGRDPAYSNVATPRYSFMGQAPGTPMSFIGR